MSDLLDEQEKRRCEARLKAYQCYILSNRQISAAIAAFEKEWNSLQGPASEHIIVDVRKLINRAVEKLESKFTLRTLTPSGPAEKVAKKIILEAADIVAAGYVEDCYAYVNGLRIHWVEHRFFTSIMQAVLHSQRLKEILEEYNATAKYLAKKFHQHCKGLHYHSLRMRVVLTESQKKQRVTYCEDMLFRVSANADYLLDVYWMDECTIWVGKDLISDKLHVWSYRAFTEGLAPQPNELFKRGNSFKINILLVVNARHGCTHVEVLTGTKGITDDQRFSVGMQNVMAQRLFLPGGPKYKTIASKLKEDAASATMEEIFDNTKVWIQTATEEAQRNFHAMLVSWDNASIHGFTGHRGGYQELGIDERQHIKLPPKSPDLHQVVEHCFGRLKAELVSAMYKVGWARVTNQWVMQWVIDWCLSIEPAQLQKDLQSLPKLYHVVSTPEGQRITVDGQRLVGSGGYYTKGSLS